MPKDRATHLLLTEMDLLDSWADRLRTLWVKDDDQAGVYLVGSALLTPGYRDVDVRIILTDKAVRKLDKVMHRPTLGLALSYEGQQTTGLPIDCQVQSLTESAAEVDKARKANPDEPFHKTLPRPLGYRHRSGARSVPLEATP